MSQGQARAAPCHVVFDGQSMNLVGGYPAALMANFPAVPWVNVAVTGASWTQLSAGATGVQPASARLFPYARGSLQPILIMCGGFTDIGSEGDSGATLYANEWAYADAARAAGFSKVLNTTLVRSTTFDAGEETARTDHNTLLLADALGKFDDVADLAGNATLADYTNTAVYFDGTHWTTDPGGTTAAAVVQPVLAPFVIA